MSFLLEGIVKNYNWGKLYNNSLINEFITDKIKYNEIEYEYLAEIWYGTHIFGTSKIINNEISIESIISKYMDKNYFNKYNYKLPFLVKILTIRHPLSIQIHPEKKLAEKLHKINYKIYPDANEKSEMALVISDYFELLYGFDDIENIRTKFSYFPNLLIFLEDKMDSKYNIPNFTKILETKDIINVINIIKKDLNEINNLGNKFINLIKDLIFIYNEDIGILVSFYMKHIVLKKGQAIFIKANTLHSYLKGDIIEIMNESDNVIRLGLTNKFKDTNIINKTLNTNIEYNTTIDLIEPIIEKNLLKYISPINFQLIHIKINKNSNKIILPNIFPQIIFIIDGFGYFKNLKKKMKKGTTLLIINYEEIVEYSENLYLICATIK